MIPNTIDEVTPHWLSQILGEQVQQFQPTQIGQGVGIMGDIYRVQLQYRRSTASAPSSVVVKLPSGFEENRSQGVALGMFEAEVRFYSELAPQARVGLPKIYHAQIDPGTANFVIVMQDLSDMTLVEQSAGMSVPQAFTAVQVLADIHAVWWGRADVPDMQWIPTMVGPRIEFVDTLLLQILPVFLAGFGRYLPPGGEQIYQQFAGNYLNINRIIAARSPWTLVHQDYRVENMLFAPAGDKVVVIDWQGIGRGPGAYDLAYLLGGSMDTDLRREHEQALVRCYHDHLMACGVDGYSFDHLWDDYGLAQLMGGLATAMVIGGGFDLSNERGVQLVASMAARHASAALDHDGMARLQNIIDGA